MDLPRGRGRQIITGGTVFLVARCPLCRQEHRYDKGPPEGEEITALLRQGYSDEWLPCQGDLPGNFWRIVLTENRPEGGQPTVRRTKGAGRG